MKPKASAQPRLQVAAGVGAIGGLAQLGGIDAGQPDCEPLLTLLYPDRVAITDREHRGANRGAGLTLEHMDSEEWVMMRSVRLS